MSQFNVLILGKSGCGKSSLLNYLWGKDLAKAGAGRPVTPKTDETNSCGIYSYQPIIRDGLKIVVHDSWGIEADKAEEWKELIVKEAHDREDKGQISDWFHSVIYCISAKGARVDSYELTAIINPLIQQGFSVVFALTKSDIASETERLEIRKYLEREAPGNSGIVELSSLAQKLRSGRETQKFGEAEILQAIIYSVKANLINKIKSQFLRRCTLRAECWKSEVLKRYDGEIGFFNSYSGVHKKVAAFAVSESQKMVVELKFWLAEITNEAQIILHELGVFFGAEQFHKESLVDLESNVIEADILQWTWVENLTNIFFHIVPVLSELYNLVKKDVHRDILDGKLVEAVNAFEVRSAGVGEKLDDYLSKVLTLPSKVVHVGQASRTRIAVIVP